MVYTGLNTENRTNTIRFSAGKDKAEYKKEKKLCIWFSFRDAHNKITMSKWMDEWV